jgi:hypothetical protein
MSSPYDMRGREVPFGAEGPVLEMLNSKIAFHTRRLEDLALS